MSKPKLAVWGAAGHALVVADILRLCGDYQVVGFLDDFNPHRHHTMFCGAPILGGQEQLARLKDNAVESLIIAVGDCNRRLQLAEIARKQGFSLASAVHPRAIVASDVIIGPGTVVAAGTVINSGTRLGENVIVNTCASVDHECLLEDGTHVCPGVHCGGQVSIGRATQVGIGATVINQIRIGAGSLIGAGSVVVSDIPDKVVAFGVPARIVRKHASRYRAAVQNIDTVHWHSELAQ